MTLKVAEHMRDKGQYDTAALLFADALPRITAESGLTRGRHGEIEIFVPREFADQVRRPETTAVEAGERNEIQSARV